MLRPASTALTSALLFVSLWAGGCSESNTPDEIQLNTEALNFVAVGATAQLTATVRDEDGDELPDEPVTWTSSNPGTASVDANGLVTATSLGTAVVTATSGALSAVANVTVAVPAKIEVAGGNSQESAAGTAVGVPPVVRVLDGADNPVAGVTVQFAVTEGGGTVLAPTKTTGDNGLAAPDGWTLGSADVNILTATVTNATVAGSPLPLVATVTSPNFTIKLEYLAEPPAKGAVDFARAKVRWQKILTGDLPDVTLNDPQPCGEGGPFPAVNETIDDIMLHVQFAPIDGPSNTLVRAAFCVVRDGGLPLYGGMQFDIDDTASVGAEDQSVPVIVHEMGHALGFGDSLFLANGLLLEPMSAGGPDPHFVGPQALAAFEEIPGGAAYNESAKVPIEDMYGPGIQDSHWRERVFGNELMTGLINPGPNPLSALTIAALADLGYQVDVSQADQYPSPPATSVLGSAVAPGRLLRNDVLQVPVRWVDPAGRTVRMSNR